MIVHKTQGSGISGTVRYVMGEGKRDPRTGEVPELAPGAPSRVAWFGGTGFGFPIDSDERLDIARRVMEWAAQNQASKTKKCVDDCLHLSLSWDKDERPTRAEMEAAAHAVLARLGMAHARAIYAAHNDTDHKHLHLVISRINPETGKAFPDSFDTKTLSAWALQWERDHGGVRCAARLANEQEQAVRGPEKVAQAYAARTPRSGFESWTEGKGGLDALSPPQRESAARSFEKWRTETNPKAAQRHGLAGYVAYVQAKEAERRTQGEGQGRDIADMAKRRRRGEGRRAASRFDARGLTPAPGAVRPSRRDRAAARAAVTRRRVAGACYRQTGETASAGQRPVRSRQRAGQLRAGTRTGHSAARIRSGPSPKEARFPVAPRIAPRDAQTVARPVFRPAAREVTRRRQAAARELVRRAGGGKGFAHRTTRSLAADYLDLCQHPLRDLRRWIALDPKRPGVAERRDQPTGGKGRGHGPATKRHFRACARKLCREPLPQVCRGLDPDGHGWRRANSLLARSTARVAANRELRPLRGTDAGLAGQGSGPHAADLASPFRGEQAALRAFYGAKIEAMRRCAPATARDLAAAVRMLLDQQRAALQELARRRQASKFSARERCKVDNSAWQEGRRARPS